MPQMGLGTSGLTGKACVDAVAAWLRLGGRYVDTALLYGNQREVGEGIRQSGVPREDVFLCTKVAFFPADSDASTWMFRDRGGAANLKGGEEASLDLCLEELGVGYVDLLLVHSPCTSAAEYRAASAPHFFELSRLHGKAGAVPEALPDGTLLRPLVLTHQRAAAAQAARAEGRGPVEALAAVEATWRALERCKASGKARHVGVSNFPAELLEAMAEFPAPAAYPAVNQLEMHPRFASPRLRAVASQRGCVLIGYGLNHALQILAQGGGSGGEVVASVARRCGGTPTQVLLAWLRTKGAVSIPRSRDPAHMSENLAALDLDLSAGDVAALDALDADHPHYWMPQATVDAISLAPSPACGLCE